MGQFLRFLASVGINVNPHLNLNLSLSLSLNLTPNPHLNLTSESGITLTLHPLTRRAVQFDRNRLTIEDIAAIADKRADAVLSTDPAFLAFIARGADFLDRLLREDGTIYGVTTGYGDSCTVTVPLNLVDELPHHLYTYHGCGLGDYLSPAQTRAVMAVRLASLSKG